MFKGAGTLKTCESVTSVVLALIKTFNMSLIRSKSDEKYSNLKIKNLTTYKSMEASILM